MKFIFNIQSKIIMLMLMINAFSAKTATAASGLIRLKNTAGAVGFSTTPVQPQTVAMQIVLAALGFVGLIFFIMILFAGYQWMTAGGNEDKVKEAKQRLQHAIIGLVVIVAAFALATYIATILIKSTTPGYYNF